MELTVKHLAPYLPYKLKAEMIDYKCDYVGKQYDTIIGFHQWDSGDLFWSALTIGGSKPELNRIKPILRNLSDLTKEIEHNGEKFVPMKKLLMEVGFGYPLECYNQDEMWILNDGYRSLAELPYRKVQMLFEWNFDVFGLIEKGLAIDINTLNK